MSVAVIAVLLVVLLTLGVGAFGLRLSRTTSDFYVASRAVGPAVNAAAISGEYLSAASFLGVAGLVATRGADMLWYPVGWTAGYLMLLLFVAAPLRRCAAPGHTRCPTSRSSVSNRVSLARWPARWSSWSRCST